MHTHATAARLALAAALLVAPASTGAQPPLRSAASAQSGSDPHFKVRLDFNRWHDVAELKADFEKLEAAFGQFTEGADLWLCVKARELLASRKAPLPA